MRIDKVIKKPNDSHRDIIKETLPDDKVSKRRHVVDKIKDTKVVKDERPDEPVKKPVVKAEPVKEATPPKDDSKFEFQITDWQSYHDQVDDEDRYCIQLFGRTEDDKDVVVKVNGFTPYFYAEVPRNWKQNDVDMFVQGLKKKVKWRCDNNDSYDYDLSESLIKYRLVQKKKFFHFTNKKMFNFVMMVFKNQTAMREFSNVLSRPMKIDNVRKGEYYFYQRYESNIDPILRFMHIQNLSSCGWACIDKAKLKAIPEYSNCDYSFKTQWNNVLPSSNDDRIAPLKIMGYDIECISKDENFPQAKRKSDKAIQIGITMYRYGSLDCYEKYLLVLGDCDPIEDTTVECYKTEKGLLKGFARLITRLRPDFKCGYNNFGFDDLYLWERVQLIDRLDAAEKDCAVEFLDKKFSDEILEIMGKLNNRYIMDMESVKKSPTVFEVKQLSSSALGDNVLSFFNIPGVISIDVMKVIQRDNRLDGYKLDNVSANFIKEQIIKIEEIDPIDAKRGDQEKIGVKIFSKEAKALEPKSYIQFMVDNGYVTSPLAESAKYKVRSIENIVEKKQKKIKEKGSDGVEIEKEITIDVPYKCIHAQIDYKHYQELKENFKEAETNQFIEVFWAFAKDDMHHSDMKKFFKEQTTKKIAKVGAYCIKDCKLVNLLIAKLEMIVNSIGMAKVCNVPLSYLFLRGQGVKIFSLVAKTCRLKNYLIPVLQKKNKDIEDEEEENSEKFEGAVVFKPKPQVYLTPIGVLDYSSLYPKSMCERNLSQEMYIDPTRRDYAEIRNLPGYKYHDIFVTKKDENGKVIRNLDGTKKKVHHVFAQELDEKGEPIYGIIPEIEMKLLLARDETKQRMKKTNDAFLKVILNSLQLAYKVVANSLYGQTGAPTSAIYFFAIAESTTAIGRERLAFAKKVVEESFPGAEIIYGEGVPKGRAGLFEEKAGVTK